MLAAGRRDEVDLEIAHALLGELAEGLRDPAVARLRRRSQQSGFGFHIFHTRLVVVALEQPVGVLCRVARLGHIGRRNPHPEAQAVAFLSSSASHQSVWKRSFVTQSPVMSPRCQPVEL